MFKIKLDTMSDTHIDWLISMCTHKHDRFDAWNHFNSTTRR